MRVLPGIRSPREEKRNPHDQLRHRAQQHQHVVPEREILLPVKTLRGHPHHESLGGFKRVGGMFEVSFSAKSEKTCEAYRRVTVERRFVSPRSQVNCFRGLTVMRCVSRNKHAEIRRGESVGFAEQMNTSRMFDSNVARYFFFIS